jgi:pimeloyl-ACP methyl ester carboxylesterase
MKKSIYLRLVPALTGMILLTTGCASPTSKIESKIAEFKRDYPDHMKSYTVGNRKLSFTWSGDPKLRPVLFIHGSPGDWTGWSEFLLNKKLQKRFHLIAVDRPGYGGSAEGGSELSLEAQAKDAMAVLSFNESGKPAILVGHSYGGAVLTQAAADDPEHVAALIFVASSVDPSLERTKWFQYPASWWPLKYLIPTPLRVCNEEITALKVELEKLEPRWSQIRAKVSTIHGDADPLVPVANQDFINSKIPKDQIIENLRVPGMNHFVPWEHPDLILDAIEKTDDSL